MTSSRVHISNVGVHVYGFAAIALGVIGLLWHDFASVWQPIDPAVPHRTAWAYLAAAGFLLAGLAVQWRRSAVVGFVLCGALYAACGYPWLLRVVEYPKMVGTWLGFAEQLTLVLAAVIGIACTYPSATTHRVRLAARIVFGLCLVVFAAAHFIALKETAAFVPQWIPLGQKFWAIATGVAHLLAGLALISGVLARLAARLFTLMIIGFGVLIWIPKLVASPHTHMMWAGNAINLAIASAAWVVADSIAQGKAGLRRKGAGAS